MASIANKPNVSSLTRLWIGILAGPIAWAVDEVVGYTVTAHECSTGSVTLIHALTYIGLLVCALGLISARSVAAIYPCCTEEHEDRIRSMAISGMALSLGFALVILATAIPKWILSPCD